MVLLTSSAISAAISGATICLFTFLLFLSGYVLQQQTVRSLQDALRNPPEKVQLPIPTLPPQFQNDHDEELQIKFSNSEQTVLKNVRSGSNQRSHGGEVEIRKLWQTYLRGFDMVIDTDEENATADNNLDVETSDDQIVRSLVTKESLAYITTLPDVHSLCSAVLFVKRHKQLSRLARAPSMVFLYPANWDVSDTKSHIAAMDLLRSMQDDADVILHPVFISRVWAGISVEQQLLAELQRYRWPYDRAIYFSSPGMLVDTGAMDNALALSNTKSSWTLLHPNPKSHEASHPSLLLWSAGRGLLYPKADMKTLAARATTTQAQNRIKGQAIDVLADDAAYIMFDERELGNGYAGKSVMSGIFERFEADRAAACAGTGLLNVS